MGISRYPRSGYRLAPFTLSEVLNKQIKSITKPNVRLFSDLSENVWGILSASEIAILVKEMFLNINLVSLPQFIKERKLPYVSKEIKFDKLELEQRTYNCLLRNHLIIEPHLFHEYKIADLLKLPGFGKLCLFDLLTSLEFFIPFHQRDTQINEQKRIAEEIIKLGSLDNLQKITSNDPRFKKIFLKIQLKSKNMLDGIKEISSKSYSYPDKKDVLKELVEFIKQIQISKKYLLEFELEDILNKSSCKKDIQVLMKLCGWDGGLPKKLREVSKEIHQSPENVRRKHLKLKALGESKPFMPVLEEAIRFIEARMPDDAGHIEKDLVANKITFSLFRIESIIFAAKQFGLAIKFDITKYNQNRLVVPSKNIRAISTVISSARKNISHLGVSTIEEIASVLEIDSKIVLKTLVYLDDFRLLDKQTGWFWLESVPRNSLLTQIKKILSVTSQISLSELRAGVARPYRMKGFAPPKRVLLELCKQLPWCNVENDKIYARQPLNISDVLNKSELILLNKITELGSIQHRRKIEESCLSEGMNKNNITMYLSYCPFIYKYSYGIYGILGANIPPGMIDTLAVEVKHKKHVLIDNKWTDDGKIRVIYKISSGMLSGGVIGIPSGVRQFLQGQFILKTLDGTVMGALKGKDNCMWGLLPFFKRRGGEPGDYLSINFDLKNKESLIDIGDEETIE